MYSPRPLLVDVLGNSLSIAQNRIAALWILLVNNPRPYYKSFTQQTIAPTIVEAKECNQLVTWNTRKI